MFVQAHHMLIPQSVIPLAYTPTVNHAEQISMLLESVHRPSDTGNCEPVPCTKEHFVRFVPIKCKTGAGMTDTILQHLQEMTLLAENMW